MRIKHFYIIHIIILIFCRISVQPIFSSDMNASCVMKKYHFSTNFKHVVQNLKNVVFFFEKVSEVFCFSSVLRSLCQVINKSNFNFKNVLLALSYHYFTSIIVPYNTFTTQCLIYEPETKMHNAFNGCLIVWLVGWCWYEYTQEGTSNMSSKNQNRQ